VKLIPPAAVGAEIASDNETLTAGTYNPTGPSSTMGIHLHPVGTADVGCGLQINHTSTPIFRVGIGITAGSAGDSSFRDDSSSTASLDIRGSHTTALGVASGAGQVVIGASSASSATPFLEVYGGSTTTDPIVQFGSGLGAGFSILLHNASGTSKQLSLMGQTSS